MKNNIDKQNNEGYLSGVICQQARRSHEIEGEWFYECKMEVKRLSEATDIIPLTISERLLEINALDLKEGRFFLFNRFSSI